MKGLTMSVQSLSACLSFLLVDSAFLTHVFAPARLTYATAC